MSSGSENVDAFVQAVRAGLSGPARPREEILAELSDGLLEAADAHERTGHERAQASQLAVQEFGDPETLATSFRGELMLARGRRTAFVLLAMTPVVLALWIAAARSRQTIGVSRLFDSPADHLEAGLLVAAVIVCGSCTLVTTGRASRWLRVPPQLSLLTATATGAFTIVCDLVAAAVLTARLAQFPGRLHTLLLATAIAASCVSALMAAHAGWSCLAMTRSASMRVPEP